MKFVIDEGASLDSQFSRPVRRMIDALQTVPDGKLLTTRCLAGRLGYGLRTLHGFCADPALTPFKLKHRTLCYFGNPRTIAAARKEFANEA